MPVPKMSNYKKNAPSSKKIKEEQVDSLVEELMGNTKKLTKSQKQRKRDLEAYLMNKLQQYDDEEDEGDEETGSSESGTEDSVSDSDSETNSSSECSCCSSGSDDDSDTNSNGDSESDSESGSGDDTESASDESESDSGSDYSKRSDEFSEEYTINGYSDDNGDF